MFQQNKEDFVLLDMTFEVVNIFILFVNKYLFEFLDKVLLLGQHIFQCKKLTLLLRSLVFVVSVA